ncbi:MAG: UDP-N-acetylmuramoyl-tripeptide--D-alanyl-D-alanine ligase [Planctomycetes bacterium]|nr:UDP-N-acetylmuramoyl-tripeptide--D-alanyl-D-alanine ligase [Planctomycetota bacterium]
MVATNSGSDSSWLTPAAVSQAASGRVVRSGPTATRVVTDSRLVQPGDLFVALRGERLDAHDFVAQALRGGAHGAVVHRDVVLGDVDRARAAATGFLVRVEDTGRALLDLAREHRRRSSARVVGITGSCGKTSTKDMLGHVLARAMATVASPKSFNNQIGVPLTLLAIRKETRAAVVEIGTNAPGEIRTLAGTAEPDVGILTCVREAHLAGLGDLEGIAREKANIFESLRADGLAILNGDDRACLRIAERLGVRTVLVRVDSVADWFATDIGFCGLGTTFRLNGERPVALPRLGTHNVYNALSCIAASSELGVTPALAIEALASLPHSSRRLEPREVAGVRIVDDSYNMNPASARAALHTLQCFDRADRRILVFGEMKELGARSVELHEALGRDVAAAGLDLLVTVGPGADPIAEGARTAGMSDARVARVADVEAGIEYLRQIVAPGDVVLCKASRAVALDRLVDGLARELGGSVAARSGG